MGRKWRNCKEEEGNELVEGKGGDLKWIWSGLVEKRGEREFGLNMKGGGGHFCELERREGEVEEWRKGRGKKWLRSDVI